MVPPSQPLNKYPLFATARTFNTVEIGNCCGDVDKYVVDIPGAISTRPPAVLFILGAVSGESLVFTYSRTVMFAGFGGWQLLLSVQDVPLVVIEADVARPGDLSKSLLEIIGATVEHTYAVEFSRTVTNESDDELGNPTGRYNAENVRLDEFFIE